MGLRCITLLYRFEVLKREVWLLGLEDCLLVRVKHNLEPRLQRSAMSVMSLMVSPDSKPSRMSPHLPRPASRFYRPLQRKITRTQEHSKLFAWGHASGSTFLLDSSLGKLAHSLTQSRTESPKEEPKPESRSVRRMLKTNEAAFTGAEFVVSKTQVKRVSKLNKSYSGKTLSRDPPGIEDAYAPNYQDRKCCGKFCNRPVDTSSLIYNRGSRFLVAQDLIEMNVSAHTQSHHPTPVKTRAFHHSRTPSEMSPELSVGKLVAKGEHALLPVCLHCYMAYDKIRKMGVSFSFKAIE